MKAGLTRREALLRLSAAVAATSRGSFFPLLDPPALPRAGGGQQRVAVAGAGCAGLAAAYELDKLGYDVTVFEARERAGGRVHTLRDAFSDDLYAEAGAVYIPLAHRLSMHYAREFGLVLDARIPLDLPRCIYLRGQRLLVKTGGTVRWPLPLTEEEQRLGLAGMEEKYYLSLLKELTRRTEAAESLDWPPREFLSYDDISFAELMRRRGASRAAVELLSYGYLNELGDGTDSYSALMQLRDFLVNPELGTMFVVRGGTDRLTAAFAQRLRDRVHYGTALVRIERGSGRVRLTVRRHAGQDVMECDRVILTLPFRVLRDVAVDPPFSEGKSRAVRELEGTSLTRIYLQTRRRVWLEQGTSGHGWSDLPIMRFWDAAENQPGPRGIMHAFIAGPNARAAAALSPDARIELALTHFEKVFPGMRTAYESGTSYSFDDDPWARGDYAFFRPGQMRSLLPHIAPAEGRVHFAGEHTSENIGWMQGAFSSARRVVREVHEASRGNSVSGECRD